jgi:hypothetical protein
MTELKADLPLAMLAHVQKTGQALAILDEVLNNDVFDNLSKHNPFWDANEEMDDLRMKFGYIQDKLIEIREIITIETHEGSYD